MYKEKKWKSTITALEKINVPLSIKRPMKTALFFQSKWAYRGLNYIDKSYFPNRAINCPIYILPHAIRLNNPPLPPPGRLCPPWNLPSFISLLDPIYRSPNYRYLYISISLNLLLPLFLSHSLEFNYHSLLVLCNIVICWFIHTL